MTRLLLVLLDLKDYYLSTQRRECRAMCIWRQTLQAKAIDISLRRSWSWRGWQSPSLGANSTYFPPRTLVLIGAGVPHTWTACPPGIDFGALGFSTEEKVASKGKFVAVFEYEAPTSFFPSAQTNTLATEEEYVRCDDLHAIRIPAMTAEEIQRQAWFVWGKEIRKLPPSQN